MEKKEQTRTDSGLKVEYRTVKICMLFILITIKQKLGLQSCSSIMVLHRLLKWGETSGAEISDRLRTAVGDCADGNNIRKLGQVCL